MVLSVTYGIIEVEDAACSMTCIGTNDCRQGIIDINGGVAPYTIKWEYKNGIIWSLDTSTLITSSNPSSGLIS